ncbi:MAG TPA: class I SAM-dependent RNA methyltransferase [Anaerolineales bacterium]|nr:class I SAM-dependent RNA methyltransferase [Anaerolineales bacterium]
MTADLLTVKLEKHTFGGSALGRVPDPMTGVGGSAIFVPFALPGETVRVRIVERKRGHLRAELVEVLDPSPERIPPRCSHFGVCGGCHYQHLSYPSQLQVKTDILRDQLTRLGKIPDPPVQPMVASPQEWNYRNHVQFHLTPTGKLGTIQANSRDILSISECHLPEAALNSVWPRLEFDPGLGLERISLRLGADEQVMLVLESGSPEAPELELEADLSVVHLADEDALVLAGDDHLTISVMERAFRVSPASFFQVNTAMAGKMVQHLLDHLPVSPRTTLLDVYCGVGLFSAFFAGRVGRLIGIEVSLSACDDFVANLDEFDHVALYQAPAELVLPGLDARPDVVILDPPRAGLDRRALEALLSLSPARLAYVSCDPATLARDAARLIAGGYRLVQVTPFDLFPQTSSIESISIFEK